MVFRMLITIIFIINSATLSLNYEDPNIKKQWSKNVVTSTTSSIEYENKQDFGDYVKETDISMQSERLNVDIFASEMIKDPLLFDISEIDSCTSEDDINRDIVEIISTKSASSVMETTTDIMFAQITEEKSTIDEDYSEAPQITSVVCIDTSYSTLTNCIMNVNKMDEIKPKKEDKNSFREYLSELTTKSDIQNLETDEFQFKKDINKNILSENSNDFTIERLEISNNEMVENGLNRNKYDEKSESSSGFKLISHVNTVTAVHVTLKEENIENFSKNSNDFATKGNVLETNAISTPVQNLETQRRITDNSERYFSAKYVNGYETEDDKKKKTDERVHDKELKYMSLMSLEDSIEENSKRNVDKKGPPALNSAIGNDMVTEMPTFALLKDDQQGPNGRAEKQIAGSKLEFPEVPEGENFRIQELGLSEGIFVFSYLSSFLSWIQPHDFPVELLRDALWKRVSVVDLITQSLQVEVGFIVCLSVGVLLALGVPCILIVHACCRLLDSGNRNSGWNDDSSSTTTNNCAVNFRRCTLVFLVQLILLLLLAGIVSMFVTNEQMTRAVDQAPRVVHTALSDVITFLRNSHEQLQFVITKSLDQAVNAVYTDLDNVEELLGRPIQDELAEETGVDVALDALTDVSTGARTMSGKVEDLLAACLETREIVMESREQLADLRMQVDMFRQQCPARFRPLCNTVNASGLDVVLRLDAVISDDRLMQIRGLRDGNLTLVTQQARGDFQYIPLRVEKDTRDARNGVKRQLSHKKENLDNSIWSLDVVTRDLTFKIENARSQSLQIVEGVSAVEHWRWLTGLGAALCVLLLWVLLLSAITCGCCGAEKRAAPTLLASVVLMCLFSVVLWAVALCALLVGGHGEVFICRPLYDEPGYKALTRLVDRPGVLFQRGGGFFSNLLYGNSTMDVPLSDVLQKCQGNGSTYTAFKLKQVFDVDSASNHRQWDMLHSELSRLHVNLSNMVLLTPELQHQLQELLHATTVNITSFRAQMTGQVTGKDLTSFADQMSSVANQITDWATLNRLENLITTTRNIMTGHIQPLEQHKEDLVYQLTALEMQLAPLQRQVNQSLSHLKTIQYYINNQGDNIAYQNSQLYTSRLISYMNQYRAHVLNKTQYHVAPCRPVWNLYHAMRLLLCRHIVDPLNGFWFATVWCLLLFIAATPPCLKLIDHYKQLKHSSGLLRSHSSESPSENLMIPEQGASWSTPGLWVLLALGLWSTAVAENVHMTKVFILPIEPGMFNWTLQGAPDQFSYRPSLLNAPDLPPWIHYIYSNRHQTGFLYGVPPPQHDSLELEIVGLNRKNYETQRRVVHMDVQEKVDPAKHEVQLKIDNLNIEDMFDSYRLNRLLDVFRHKLWRESVNDLYVTFLASAVHLGARLPLRPNDGEGVVIRIGSKVEFSTALIELRNEVKPLSKLGSCPRDFKRTTVERSFRDEGFALDWCAFRLIDTEISKPFPASREEDTSEENKPFLRYEDRWMRPSKLQVPQRSYVSEFIHTIMLPMLVMIILVLILSLILCFHHEGISKRNKETPAVQMVQYTAVHRASNTLRSLSNQRQVPNASSEQSSTMVSCAHTGSPNNSLPRTSTPRSSMEYGTYYRPNPPPYTGPTNSRGDF